MKFTIERKLQKELGRAGVIETAHGKIHTPAFVAVGTKATVKALTPAQIAELGCEVVLGNTYHLYLEPGSGVVKKGGGLGAFMGWSGPTITDSGGFQVFSLGAAFGLKRSKIASSERKNTAGLTNTKTHLQHPYKPENVGVLSGEKREVPLAKIDNDGVTFSSPKDGSRHRFTPEKSIEIQHDLGADILFAFDECASPEAPHDYQKKAMERTHRWAERSLARHHELKAESEKLKVNGQQSKVALFGIVQGGRFPDLRKESARTIGRMELARTDGSRGGFDGFGIGGSFEKEDIDAVLCWVNAILPEEKPRHLLGIGEPTDLLGAVEMGCDLFDCVAPTRQARNGMLYTAQGKINIENAKYKNDFSPIEEECGCYTCLPRQKGGAGLTKAYLSHLFRSKEILANTLATMHNLYFFVHLVKGMRQAILDGNLIAFREHFLAGYQS